MNDGKSWLIPLTGVAAIVIAIAGFAIGGEPPSVDENSAEEIVEHYVDNKDSVMFGSGLATIAMTFLIFFFGYLRKVLRAAEGEAGTLSLIAFAGSAIFGLGIAIDSTLSFTLAETAEDIDPTAAQSLAALFENDFMPFALGTQLMLLGAGISVVKHGLLPKWLGWIAILFGVIAVTPIGFVSAAALALWVVVVSILLSMRARGPSAPAAPAA